MTRLEGTRYQLRVDSDSMPLLFEGIMRQRRALVVVRLDSDTRVGARSSAQTA